MSHQPTKSASARRLSGAETREEAAGLAFDFSGLRQALLLRDCGLETLGLQGLVLAVLAQLRVHVVLTEGTSLRLTQATSGQGVVPLGQEPRRSAG
ncbi:hypothetical protein ABZ746_34340 [Streptomyces sp. NPDC020096]